MRNASAPDERYAYPFVGRCARCGHDASLHDLLLTATAVRMASRCLAGGSDATTCACDEFVWDESSDDGAQHEEGT